MCHLEASVAAAAVSCLPALVLLLLVGVLELQVYKLKPAGCRAAQQLHSPAQGLLCGDAIITRHWLSLSLALSLSPQHLFIVHRAFSFCSPPHFLSISVRFSTLNTKDRKTGGGLGTV